MKKLFTYLLISFLVFGTITISSVSVIAAPTDIKNLTVWLNGDNAGENGTYYISFTNSDTPLLAANQDAITIQFPVGTVLAKSSLATGDIKLNNIAIDANDPTKVIVDQGNRTITFEVPFDILADAYTLIEVTKSAGVYNPTTTGSYQLQVDFTVSGATTVLTTNNYAIRGTQISSQKLELSNTGTGKSSNYTISFKGSIVENDLIYLLLPKEYNFVITNNLVNSVQINGKTAKQVTAERILQGTPREGLLLTLTVPNGISTFTNKDVKVTIAANSYLKNPSTEGDYPVTVYTSRDVVPVTTNTVAIRNQSSNISVNLSPTTVREAGEYRIQFRTTGAIPANTGYIEVLFPSDTSVPSSISNGHVLINNSLSRLVERDTNNARLLRMYLPDNLSLAANTDVTLLISTRAGIRNPSTNGNYTVQLRTITDQSFAHSSTYSITGGTTTNPTNPNPTQPGTPSAGQGTNMGIQISSTDPNTTSRYDISYRTSTTGILRGGTDEITIIFLNTVQLPTFINREDILVNSVPLDNGMVKISNQSINFRLPTKVNVAGNSTFTITISEKANIRHPQSSGTYTLYVLTNKDGTVGYTYQLQGKATYNFYIEPVYDAQRQIISYTMTSKNQRYVTLRGGEDWVELTLPKSITQSQLAKLTLYVNGYIVDMNKVQLADQRMSFFIPKGVNIAHNSDLNILLHDKEHVLTEGYNTTITFKIKTSRDTVDTESNRIATYAPTNTTIPTIPTQPTSPNTGTQQPSPSTPGTSTHTTIKLYLGKKETYINNVRSTDLLAAPYIHPQKDGNTMVPVRFISEALGAKVDYKPEGQKITITYLSQYLVLTIGSDIVLKQGGGERLPVPVEAKADGITFVPVRFISEWLGFKVSYNPTDKSIILQK